MMGVKSHQQTHYQGDAAGHQECPGGAEPVNEGGIQQNTHQLPAATVVAMWDARFFAILSG